MAPTPQSHQAAHPTTQIPAIRLYPQFSGCEGPSQLLDPSDNDELALVWPTSLCELIAIETNRYAQQNNCPKWVDDEVWIFLWIVVLMGIHTKLRTTGAWTVCRQCSSQCPLEDFGNCGPNFT